MNLDHSNDGIVETGQNTEKDPGNLRRFDAGQNQVKDYLLTLAWSNKLQGVTILIIID